MSFLRYRAYMKTKQLLVQIEEEVSWAILERGEVDNCDDNGVGGLAFDRFDEARDKWSKDMSFSFLGS